MMEHGTYADVRLVIFAQTRMTYTSPVFSLLASEPKNQTLVLLGAIGLGVAIGVGGALFINYKVLKLGKTRAGVEFETILQTNPATVQELMQGTQLSGFAGKLTVIFWLQQMIRTGRVVVINPPQGTPLAQRALGRRYRLST